MNVRNCKAFIIIDNLMFNQISRYIFFFFTSMMYEREEKKNQTNTNTRNFDLWRVIFTNNRKTISNKIAHTGPKEILAIKRKKKEKKRKEAQCTCTWKFYNAQKHTYGSSFGLSKGRCKQMYKFWKRREKKWQKVLVAVFVEAQKTGVFEMWAKSL